MYVYKALVHCLPASNKLKLVQLVNQNSSKVVDVIQLAYYHFGVIAQASGQYAGATLVRVEQAEQGRNFIVEHCCVAEKFRRHGFARDMLKIVQDEVQQYDKATMELALDDEEWKGDFLERSGWVQVKTDMQTMTWQYDQDR